MGHSDWKSVGELYFGYTNAKNIAMPSPSTPSILERAFSQTSTSLTSHSRVSTS